MFRGGNALCALRVVLSRLTRTTAGHYTACCLSEVDDGQGGTTSRWLYCNDDHVSEISSQHVVSDLAYCLFYKRRHVSPHNAVNLSTAPAK